MKVIAGVYSGVTTVELDTLAAETAAAMTTKHPDYAILAARIAVSNLHKETQKLFSCKWYLRPLLVVNVFLDAPELTKACGRAVIIITSTFPDTKDRMLTIMN